jgi:aspartyl-tRNA(Asn)/glutamyl-tRNA(Gln) amidotransferase subunit A
LTEEEGEGTVVAVKDLVDVKGTVTTAGGIMLPETPAAADAPLVAEMRRQGCLVVGKANLHEWAFGITSGNPHYGAVRNPHDRDRIPGGSSGGSAVAVVTGMCDWAVGSDTGGSIRIPASLCGCVGFKPTRGTVSTEGVFPLARSLDTMGPLAPDVDTAARALEAMTGRHDIAPRVEVDVSLFKIGVPKGWIRDLDEPTDAAWRAVSKGLPEIDFPEQSRLSAAGLTILLYEAAQVHRKWLATSPEKYGDDVRELLTMGTRVSESDYRAAVADADGLRPELEAALEGWDAVLLPATACVAPKIGAGLETREPLTRYTRPFNTTGHPVVCLPAPVKAGLPVGIQVVGHFGADARLAEVAGALEVSWA